TDAKATEGAAAAATPAAPAAAKKTAGVDNTSQRGPDAPAAASNAPSDWGFDYHGYIRAPMRVGMGHKDTVINGESKTTFHRPIIPDDQYLSWQSTPHNKSDWAEAFFTVGNSFAKATIALQSYNFTEATWGYTDTQLGIAQGYVTLYSDLGYENV